MIDDLDIWGMTDSAFHALDPAEQLRFLDEKLMRLPPSARIPALHDADENAGFWVDTLDPATRRMVFARIFEGLTAEAQAAAIEWCHGARKETAPDFRVEGGSE